MMSNPSNNLPPRIVHVSPDLKIRSLDTGRWFDVLATDEPNQYRGNYDLPKNYTNEPITYRFELYKKRSSQDNEYIPTGFIETIIVEPQPIPEYI